VTRGAVPAKLGRGLCSFARLVAALKEEPRTADQVQVRFNISTSTARRATRRLLDLRVLCVVELRAANMGPAARVYGVGEPLACVPQRPVNRDGRRSRHCATASVAPAHEPTRFAAVWHALKAPSSVEDLSAMTGVCPHTLYKLLRCMRSLRLARIGDWEVGRGGERTALWCLGAGNHKTKPPPIDLTELNRAYRERRRMRESGPRITRALAANASIFTLAGAA